MKTFEIVIIDREITIYSSTYEVQAENEEEAKKIVFSGDGSHFCTDTENCNEEDFTEENIKKYLSGEKKYRELESCTETLSQEEKEEEKLLKEKQDLEVRLQEIDSKLK